jgi:hypothetical protein
VSIPTGHEAIIIIKTIFFTISLHHQNIFMYIYKSFYPLCFLRVWFLCAPLHHVAVRAQNVMRGANRESLTSIGTRQSVRKLCMCQDLFSYYHLNRFGKCFLKLKSGAIEKIRKNIPQVFLKFKIQSTRTVRVFTIIFSKHWHSSLLSNASSIVESVYTFPKISRCRKAFILQNEHFS